MDRFSIKAKDGCWFVRGYLDETTSFTEVAASEGAILLNFSGMAMANSAGLARLMTFMRECRDRTVEFHECPRVLIDMLGPMRTLLGPKRDPRVVASFIVPYACSACHHQEEHLVAMASLGRQGAVPTVPPRPCSKCGSALHLDEAPEEYFAFMAPT